MRVASISVFHRDSAAALIEDDRITAAAQQERFSRRKHDARYSQQATGYCPAQACVGLEAIEAVVFCDKPLLNFECGLEAYLPCAPRRLPSFHKAMPLWLQEKLF